MNSNGPGFISCSTFFKSRIPIYFCNSLRQFPDWPLTLYQFGCTFIFQMLVLPVQNKIKHPETLLSLYTRTHFILFLGSLKSKK